LIIKAPQSMGLLLSKLFLFFVLVRILIHVFVLFFILEVADHVAAAADAISLAIAAMEA